MLELLTPRIIQRHALRLRREFGLDDAVLSRSRKLLVSLLRDGAALTRGQIYQALEANGIAAAGQRGIHIIGRLAQEGLICFGPRRGKQQTFVLLDLWVEESRGLLRDEALAELALRYFTSHGPATVNDYVWWSGLTVRDARAGLAMIERSLRREEIAGESYWSVDSGATAPRNSAAAHLLPPFDEYLVGYKERGAVLQPKHAGRVPALLSPVMEVSGRIVGTWTRQMARGAVVVKPCPFRRLLPAEKAALAGAAERFGRFLGVTATLY